MNAKQAIAGAARELSNVLKMARLTADDRAALGKVIADLEALSQAPPPKPAPKKKATPKRKTKKPADIREKAVSPKAEGRDIRFTEF